MDMTETRRACLAVIQSQDSTDTQLIEGVAHFIRSWASGDLDWDAHRAARRVIALVRSS